LTSSIVKSSDFVDLLTPNPVCVSTVLLCLSLPVSVSVLFLTLFFVFCFENALAFH